MTKLTRLPAQLIAVLIITAPLTQPVSGAPPKARQEVEGEVLLPAPEPRNRFQFCWSGLHRRIMTLTGESAQGVFGYHFEIDKKTWKQPFVLEVTGGEQSIDLDITFFFHIPPVEEWPSNPLDAGYATGASYSTRKEGGEVGRVPRGAQTGFVCLYGSLSRFGYDASFKYTAGKGVPPPPKGVRPI